MEKFKQKLNSLRSEVDLANARADVAEAKLKKLQDQLRQKDTEIIELGNKLALVREDSARRDAALAEVKRRNEALEATDDSHKRLASALGNDCSVLERKVEEIEALYQATKKELEREPRVASDSGKSCVPEEHFPGAAEYYSAVRVGYREFGDPSSMAVGVDVGQPPLLTALFWQLQISSAVVFLDD